MLPLGFVALEGMLSSGMNNQCKCKEVGARSHRKGRADRRAPLKGTKSTEMRTESVDGSTPGRKGQCLLYKGSVFPAGDTQVSGTTAVLGGAAESCGNGVSNVEKGNKERSDLETEAREEKEDTQKARQVIGEGNQKPHCSCLFAFSFSILCA